VYVKVPLGPSVILKWIKIN